MTAIQTRYIGPTNFRGSRVVAETMDGAEHIRRMYCDWEDGLNAEQNHHAAAIKLIQKLGWNRRAGTTYGDWFAGATDRGYVFVCALDYCKLDIPEAV